MSWVEGNGWRGLRNCHVKKKWHQKFLDITDVPDIIAFNEGIYTQAHRSAEKAVRGTGVEVPFTITEQVACGGGSGEGGSAEGNGEAMNTEIDEDIRKQFMRTLRRYIRASTSMDHNETHNGGRWNRELEEEYESSSRELYDALEFLICDKSIS